MRDPAAWLVGFCVLLQIFGACGACWNITYSEPFCRDSSCYADGGDAE
jgi:hypothetical protein